MKITRLLMLFAVGLLISGCDSRQTNQVSEETWNKYFDARNLVFNNSFVYQVLVDTATKVDFEIDHGKVRVFMAPEASNHTFYELTKSTDTFTKIVGDRRYGDDYYWIRYEIDDPRHTLDYFFLNNWFYDNVFLYSDFSYDSEKNIYTNNKPITQHVNSSAYGRGDDFDRNISNVIVEFNSKKQLSSVTFDAIHVVDGRTCSYPYCISILKYDNVTVTLPEADTVIKY